MGHGGVFLGEGKTMTIPTCRGAIPRRGQTWCGPGETEDQKRETLEGILATKDFSTGRVPRMHQALPQRCASRCRHMSR